MTDRLTVLRHSRNRMAKTWCADGTVKPYDEAKRFQLAEHEVGDIRALSALLQRLEADPHACVIRGRYVGDDVARQRDPTEFKAGTVRRALDYFEDQRLHAVMLDVDGFTPAAVPLQDPVRAIDQFLAECLPEAFHGVSYHWQLSNSAGRAESAGKLKAHVWFWLASAHTSAQLKAWAKSLQLPIDVAVFNAVQVHYTAKPLLEAGVKDPVRERSGFSAGVLDDAVQLVIDPAQLADAATAAGGRGERLRQLQLADPIAQRLAELGLVKSCGRDGQLKVECPFEDEHTGPSAETATVYWPPHTGGHSQGNFKCLHAHCADRPRRAFLQKLAEDPGGVHRPEILDELEGNFAAEFQPIEAPSVSAAALGTPVPATRPAAVVAAVPEAFPGPMAAAVRAALSAAPKPQPELTVFAALAGMAAGCPGHYRTTSGLRPNLYVCGVAETGAGKELPRNVAVEIAKACDARVIGRPASGEAIEDLLQAYAPVLCEVDEAAHMLAAVNGSKAPPHLIAVASNMLKLFTASANRYSTRARAWTRGAPPSREVAHPCFNFVGFTTPGKLGESVTFGNIADGLLGRMLFVFGRDQVTPRRSAAGFQVPEEVVQVANQIGHAAALSAAQNEAVPDIVIAEGEGVGRALDALLTSLDARAGLSASTFARALLVRSFEKVERIAAVLAIWDCPAAPVMRPDHVEWAHRTVLASDAALLRFAEDFMHEGQVQADASRVLDVLRKVLSGGLKPETPTEAEMMARGSAAASLVLRRCKLEARRFNEAVSHLVQTAQVSQGQEGEGARRVRVLQLGAA